MREGGIPANEIECVHDIHESQLREVIDNGGVGASRRPASGKQKNAEQDDAASAPIRARYDERDIRV